MPVFYFKLDYPENMDALIAISSIVYILWPAILLIGLRELFHKNLAIWERFYLAIKHVFVAWIVWAIFLGFIYWQGSIPILLFPKVIDHILFGALGLMTGGITLAGWIVNWRKNRIQLEDARTLDKLLALSPGDFEVLVAKLFTSYGHQAEVAGSTSDHGVDVIVRSIQGEKWVVQCKRYTGSVGEPVIRDLYGTMQHEDAQQAYLMTTGNITTQAKLWAEGKPIVLYDGKQLVKLIRRTVSHKGREI